MLKYVTQTKTLSVKARKLIPEVFIRPHLQIIYVVWPMLLISSIEKIDRCLASYTIDRLQPMMKCSDYQTTRQQKRKHNTSFGDSLIMLKRCHPDSSKITFSTTPCQCVSANAHRRISAHLCFTSRKIQPLRQWSDDPFMEDRRQYSQDHSSILLKKEHKKRDKTRNRNRLEIETFYRVSYSHGFGQMKALTHTHTNQATLCIKRNQCQVWTGKKASIKRNSYHNRDSRCCYRESNHFPYRGKVWLMYLRLGQKQDYRGKWSRSQQSYSYMSCKTQHNLIQSTNDSQVLNNQAR